MRSPGWLAGFQFPPRYLTVKGEIRQIRPRSCKTVDVVAKRPREFLDSRLRLLRRLSVLLSRTTRVRFFVLGYIASVVTALGRQSRNLRFTLCNLWKVRN